MNFAGHVYCSAAECGRKREAAEQKAALAKDLERRRASFRETIPQRYRFADEVNDGKNFPALPEGPEDILFLGPNGRGKTFAAAVYALRISALGFSCYWQDATMLVLRLRAVYRDGSKESELDVIQEFQKPNLLLLDDFGAEKATDYSMQSFYAIIAQRMNADKATVLTTNLSLAALQEAEPRIASRLNGFLMLGMAGPDRRAVDRKRAGGA